jgi:hypothetical protein
MPAGDRTGPWSAGPRTGRGVGYCSGNAHPGYMTPGPGLGFGGGIGAGWGRGRGFGRGMGRGRGFRHYGIGHFRGFPYVWEEPFGYPTGPRFNMAADEETFLARQAEELEDELKRIRERQAEITKDRDEKAST